MLRDAYLIERALYEIVYELNNRPDPLVNDLDPHAIVLIPHVNAPKSHVHVETRTSACSAHPAPPSLTATPAPAQRSLYGA